VRLRSASAPALSNSTLRTTRPSFQPRRTVGFKGSIWLSVMSQDIGNPPQGTLGKVLGGHAGISWLRPERSGLRGVDATTQRLTSPSSSSTEHGRVRGVVRIVVSPFSRSRPKDSAARRAALNEAQSSDLRNSWISLAVRPADSSSRVYLWSRPCLPMRRRSASMRAGLWA